MAERAIIVNDPLSLQERSAPWRESGQRIAFVPTMGNLHAGHFALVKQAKTLADRVIVSIFVNPTQFGPGEDLDSYPRTFEADRRGLEQHHCDMIYTPSVATMYPGGTLGATLVHPPEELVDRLCGRSRPGHFDGVATVVVTLFNQVKPDLALFGEKDFQQLMVIQRIVHDLSMSVEVVPVPTVREASGLAMSSRNGYLSGEERQRAAVIYQVLTRVAAGLKGGENTELLREQGLIELEEAGLEPEYLEVLSATNLGPPATADQRVVLAAARLGSARLIDNIRVEVER